MWNVKLFKRAVMDGRMFDVIKCWIGSCPKIMLQYALDDGTITDEYIILMVEMMKVEKGCTIFRVEVKYHCVELAMAVSSGRDGISEYIVGDLDAEFYGALQERNNDANVYGACILWMEEQYGVSGALSEPLSSLIDGWYEQYQILSAFVGTRPIPLQSIKDAKGPMTPNEFKAFCFEQLVLSLSTDE